MNVDPSDQEIKEALEVGLRSDEWLRLMGPNAISLREFQKLTPESQQVMIDSQKIWIATAQSAHTEGGKEAKGGKKEMPPARPGCCDAVKSLVDQLPDERKGVEYYAKMAGEMVVLGEDMMADVFNNLSDQEYEHFLLLVGIIDQLTESCGCPKVHIPPIGGD